MASPRIEPYIGEITGLLDRGMSQAAIICEFKNKGVDIPRSSLSDFARSLQADNAAVATVNDTETAERFDAALRFQQASAAEFIERMADVIEGLQQLKREGDERFASLKTLLEGLPREDAGGDDAGRLSVEIDAAIGRIDALAARTAGAGLRWVWLKACFYTSLV